ncbi:MAG: hypothetical protein HOG49_21385 [Candidatus Scalindua sp.]|jgi:thymidylate synthase ThyX|nr:hypothetical protein [Candidatus Scalindua sp.]
MEIGSKVICHSSFEGREIISIEMIAPKFLNAETNTHRVFSRNASSSRAIPISKTVKNICSDPYIPKDIRINQKGMQGFEKLDEQSRFEFEEECQRLAIINSQFIQSWHEKFNIHKQHLNRYAEAWVWQKLIVTSTEWDNWFHLRNHPMADPAIQALAIDMLNKIEDSTPNVLTNHQWHTPYVNDSQIEQCHYPSDILKVSSAGCARTSYNNYDGSKTNLESDTRLFNQLVVRPYSDDVIDLTENDPIHASPTEHQAKPMKSSDCHDGNFNPALWEKGITHMDTDMCYWSNNFKGWIQHRSIL